jgi:hypothetical protein
MLEDFAKAAMHELLKIQYFHQQKFNTNKIIQSEEKWQCTLHTIAGPPTRSGAQVSSYFSGLCHGSY